MNLPGERRDVEQLVDAFPTSHDAHLGKRTERHDTTSLENLSAVRQGQVPDFLPVPSTA